jgi:excisionase family DNA binding protein
VAAVTAIARVLLDELGQDELQELADALAPYLPQPEPADTDRWMTTREAAEYLGITRNALHKLTAARAIPFSQDVAGGKCWFLKSELDDWRRRGGRA